MKADATRPCFVAFEGPAGAGKTTVAENLRYRLQQEGSDAKVGPEFSDSPIGSCLALNSAFGTKSEGWQRGIGGLATYLSDKIRVLERARGAPEVLWIFDRTPLTQLVVGMDRIKAPADRQVAASLIDGVQRWMEGLFASNSIMIFLLPSIEILKSRISKRLGVEILDNDLSSRLQNELGMYQELAENISHWNTLSLNTSGNPVSDVVAAVLNAMPSR